MPSLNTVQKIMAGGILFLLPFLCNPFAGDMTLQFEAPKLFGAFFLGNLCFAFFLAQRIHPAFGVLHFAFSFSVLVTGFGPSQLYPYAYWVAAVFLALFATNLERDDDQEKFLWLWQCIALGGILSAIHACLQMAGFSWPLHYAPGIDSRTPIAMLGQQTKLGAFLAPCTAICLAQRSRFWACGAALCAFVCAMTGSSFTLFSLVIGILVVLVGTPHLKPRLVLAPLVLGILLVVVGPHFGAVGGILDDHGRHLAYRDTFLAWRQRPIFGYGPGAFQVIFHKTFQSLETRNIGGGDYIQAHFDPLQALFDFGLWGFLPLCYALLAIFRAYAVRWSMVRMAWYMSNGFTHEQTTILCAQGALAALLVNCLGNFPWQLSPHYLVGVLAAAILLRSARY